MAGFPKGKGIEDFGNFGNDQYCFKLNQTHPQTQTFIICAADQVKIKKINLLFFLEN